MPHWPGVLAQERNRDVERDPIHPGGERALRRITGISLPQLEHDLLGEIVPVGVAAGVTGRHFANDPAVLLDQAEKNRLFVNGQRLDGPWDFEGLMAAIEEVTAGQKAKSAASSENRG